MAPAAPERVVPRAKEGDGDDRDDDRQGHIHGRRQSDGRRTPFPGSRSCSDADAQLGTRARECCLSRIAAAPWSPRRRLAQLLLFVQRGSERHLTKAVQHCSSRRRAVVSSCASGRRRGCREKSRPARLGARPSRTSSEPSGLRGATRGALELQQLRPRGNRDVRTRAGLEVQLSSDR